ncbi:MAG: hypothetical protein VKJ25_18375 [Okeania sp.]|nr:hypothetical protein [Okeania sp.]MEB3342707.1 hypothetical protein [Okeania sp.]
MGKITTNLVINNHINKTNASQGWISIEEVRYIVIKYVLVDTGATTLCLPPEAIAQLGLEILK